MIKNDKGRYIEMNKNKKEEVIKRIEGNPVIKGTRIKMSLVLAYIRDERGGFEELKEDFDLSNEQIEGVLDVIIDILHDLE